MSGIVRNVSVGLILAVAFAGAAWTAEPDDGGDYSNLVLHDRPVAYWTFQKKVNGEFPNSVSEIELTAKRSGAVQVDWPGPQTPAFPLLASHNVAVRFEGGGQFLRVTDPGEKSPLDFDAGESITLEAWVAPEELGAGRYAYVVGKGRTQREGVAKENQNWALRLYGQNGGAALTFLFRSRGSDGEFHRWTSTETFGVGDGWHHVAIGYVFGKKDSLRAFIDGDAVKGIWDLGGATDRAPVVDDDEIWIGSSMGGQANSTFHGAIDEVAVYRRVLDAQQIGAHFQFVPPKSEPVAVPDKQVLVQIFEGLPDKKSWNVRPPQLADSFTTTTLAFPELPKKYSPRGIHVDRASPFLVRAHAVMELPSGRQRLLIRARGTARLFLDEQKIAETPFFQIDPDAHGELWELDASVAPHIRPLQRGDRQAVAEVDGDGRPHTLRFETVVGGSRRRPELGDASVSIGPLDGDFRLLSFDREFAVTVDGWQEFAEQQRREITELNTQRRNDAGREETAYWQWRHELARRFVAEKLAASGGSPTAPASGEIDRLILARLERAGQSPRPLLDDLAFLRRATLDVIGTVPDRAMISQFEADSPSERRRLLIDRLLEHPSWADHWVGYWQDVLAENPNLVNPTLNNTGPFRWWIHESFLENKPFDRFVTELIRMEGSSHFGGPGGFSMATQNDVPMAAKAHIIGQAFLGVQMQCARCHDAPDDSVLQRDLFSLAALLNRGALEVPATSSINVPPEKLEKMMVRVTLKPGTKVSPAWTFEKLMGRPIPDGVLRSEADARERVAALVTLPYNERFAKVIVNRLWKRYLGHGLVEPVHDWHAAEPSHPKLLEFLADDFVVHNFDLKHTARLILNSQVYQRHGVGGDEISSDESFLFAGPKRRTLTAEQMVDSLFVISGKPYDAGPMCIDIDSARPVDSSLNLDVPRRAWMFTSLSNERDRPSLDLPFAGPFVNFMEQFGWRGARQNPVNDRPEDLTALQPAEFANGLLVRRATHLSDDHRLTRLALTADLTLDRLIGELYLAMCTRTPTDAERRVIAELLAPGFESRHIPDAPLNPRPKTRRGMVSWSNHLEVEANNIQLELAEFVRRGDLPTQQLESDWRERLEDVVWSLVNSPEFRFVP